MGSYPPRYFSWIEDGKLAAFGWPSTPANLRYLIDNGIVHLVTLSPEKRPFIHAFPELEWTEIKIREFDPPTITQIEKFMKVCDKAFQKTEAVGVHCRMGRGRTGTMLACYFVKFHSMSPRDAVDTVRKLRPGSVETYSQEVTVMDYHIYLCKNYN
ncbi:dual specificity protein phosphatase 23-like [Limulus polyphemus]|uniref:Dual specificity protein phosphatase 23-like n=1 Tax=Limulus polyphemus TaxID=6850 RepID=A0ABM1BQ63_LIMPO|nr:dual specificity protein phosphatase 23-like [Limulus polyphemus]